MLATSVFAKKRTKILTSQKWKWLVFALFHGVIQTIAVFMPQYLNAEVKKHERFERHMGCEFKITIYCESPATVQKAFELAFVRIRELDEVLSNYRSSSELNRVCRSAPHKSPIPISKDLYDCLDLSRTMHRLSNGAFDPTVGPLTKLWRRAHRRKKLPSDKRIAQTMNAVGFDHVGLVEGEYAVALKKPQMQLDLGGIAKGFAVDQALDLIKSTGIAIACVNGGGDIAVGDPPPGKEGWTIGIAAASPKLSNRTLVLSNMAVATSGDLFQFVEIDGVRYSHIVDPRTGYGLTNSAAVTVIAPSCSLADGMASAISVLGTTEGIRIASTQPGVEVLCSELRASDEAQIDTKTTAGFSQFESTTPVR